MFQTTNQIPSGKLSHNYGKSPLFMGKLTISMASFNRFLYVYQRVCIYIYMDIYDQWTINDDSSYVLKSIYIDIHMYFYMYMIIYVHSDDSGPSMIFSWDRGIPSIYPLYVNAYIPAPWIRHGI